MPIESVEHAFSLSYSIRIHTFSCYLLTRIFLVESNRDSDNKGNRK